MVNIVNERNITIKCEFVSTGKEIYITCWFLLKYVIERGIPVYGIGYYYHAKYIYILEILLIKSGCSSTFHTQDLEEIQGF